VAIRGMCFAHGAERLSHTLRYWKRRHFIPERVVQRLHMQPLEIMDLAHFRLHMKPQRLHVLPVETQGGTHEHNT